MLKERVEQWKREFKEEGVREGIEKGIEKGIERGEAEMFTRLLTAKFGRIDQTSQDRIDQAGAEQLLLWAERVLIADKIEQFFDE